MAFGPVRASATTAGTGRQWAGNGSTRKWSSVGRAPAAMGGNRAIDVPLVGVLRPVVPQLTAAMKGSPRKASPELAKWIEADNNVTKTEAGLYGLGIANNGGRAG